ncbi:MAG TPA: glutathione S-transferase N-terminal domain-containing protein [Gammaproteobacteria bacterium]|nr:glutathione S-transferase N-terminal domain-containing protein [Gammaproteobacteria bacterium]
MKLYALPGTCALAPNIALQWAGADYEVALIERDALKQPEHLARHPLGKVPVLVRDDGRVMTEVPALLDWIAEAYPDAGLGGTSADERYAINRWLSFMSAEVHASAYGPHFAPQRFHPDPAQHDAVRATAHQRLPALYGILEAGLASGHPVGGRRTAADPLLYVLTRWTDVTPLDLEEYPALRDFRGAMEADPGVDRALTLQGMKG